MWSSMYVEVMVIKPGMPTELHFWNICIKNLQFSMVSEIDNFFAVAQLLVDLETVLCLWVVVLFLVPADVFYY
jgi:hypothetical protein